MTESSSHAAPPTSNAPRRLHRLFGDIMWKHSMVSGSFSTAPETYIASYYTGFVP
jgi:hypothetical protein